MVQGVLPQLMRQLWKWLTLVFCKDTVHHGSTEGVVVSQQTNVKQVCT